LFCRGRRPRARALPLIALCGLAGMTAYQLLLNQGERVVPAGTASLLVATAPGYANLFAIWFLGEGAAPLPPPVGRQRLGLRRLGGNRGLPRPRLRRRRADRAGRRRAPGCLPHR